MIRIILKENTSTKNLVVEHNTDFLLDDEVFIKKFTVGISYSRLEMFIRQLISKIPTLSETKLVKNIGKGAEGIAYELSNGNVFKIGKDTRGTLDTANKSAADNFSKQGSSALPHVYNSGEIEIGSSSLSWKEMTKYTTFIEWFQFVRPNSKKTKKVFDQIYFACGLIQVLMMNYANKTGKLPSLKTLIEYTSKYTGEVDAILSELGKDFYERLVKAVYELGRRHDYSKENIVDAKADNLGIDQHGNFVFFDF